MEVQPLSTIVSATASPGQSDLSQSTAARSAFEAVRKLNTLEITDREFSVVRDPQSHRFVVVVLDAKTGTVLDQFPPEDILKMLAQLSRFSTTTSGATQV